MEKAKEAEKDRQKLLSLQGEDVNQDASRKPDKKKSNAFFKHNPVDDYQEIEL